MRRTLFYAALAIASCNGHVRAEDAPDPNAAAKAETARLEAATALVNAKAAYQNAKIAALGLPKFDGKTTVDAAAGKAEVGLLVAGATATAADEIKKRVTAKSTGRRVLLLTSEEAPSLRAAALFDSEVASRRTAMETAHRDQRCAAPATAGAHWLGLDPAASFTGVTAAIGAVAGLLRTDIEVTGVELSTDERLLIDALAAREVGLSRAVFADILAPEVNTYARELNGLQAERDKLARCAEKFAADKPKVAALNTIIGTTDEFIAKATTPDDSGWSPLLLAARATAAGDKPLILRVRVAQASGTTLKRANLWTMLGAPAIAISGALIVSFRLSDPKTGQIQVAGTLACRTTLADIRKIQTATRPLGECI